MPLLNLPDFADTLLADFTGRGTALVTIPVIQPAAPFLDMAGEDLRRRIFTTESETGEALCLRPEFTIPVCMDHIEANAGTPRRYGYLGEVFRQRREGPSEFYQAGIEDLGDHDIAAADARAVRDAHEVLAALLPATSLDVTLGDQTVFEAVLAALGLPAGWQQRLVRAFGDRAQLDAMLEGLTRGEANGVVDGAVAGFVATEDPAGLVAHIADAMEATGYSTNASRTPEDIAERLMEKARLARARLDARAFSVLSEFLSLEVPLAEAPSALAGFADAAGLDLASMLKRFDARVAALAATDAEIGAMRYRAAFGRPLDYYTGLVFEVTGAGGTVLAGGGRYDRLLTLLGAAEPIPAVGFSLWLDRVTAIKGASR